MMRKRKEKAKKKTGLLGRWEAPYNRPLDIILDLAFCLIGLIYLLGFGPFPLAVKLIIALATTGLFFFFPNLSMFVFAFLFFLCTAHINGALAVVIGVAVLLLVGSNHKQACLIILTPAAFTLETLFTGDISPGMGLFLSCIPVALWILFIFISAKQKDFMPASFYSIYFGFMAIMTNSFGAMIYGYPRELPWVPAEFGNYSEFVRSIFIIKPETWMLDYSFYGTICFVAITMFAGIGMYKIYAMDKGFGEIQNKWLFDALKFALFIPALALYFMILIVALNLQIPGYLTMIIAGVILGFVVTRGLMVDTVKVNAVDAQIHEMIESRMSDEDKKQYHKDINLDDANESETRDGDEQ